MPYDNPAARLKTILEAGLQADRKKQCAAVWRDLVGPGTNGSDELYSRLGKVMDLPRQVIDELRTHFPQHVATSNLWRDPIEAAFMSQQLGATWESFIQHINPYCAPQLGLLADLLHGRAALELAEMSAVQELISKLTELAKDVAHSDASSSVKAFVGRSLADIVQALSEYQIVGGTEAVRRAEATVGHASRDKEFFHFLRDEKLGQRVLDNLNAVAAVMTIYVSLPQLTTTTFQLLGQ